MAVDLAEGLPTLATLAFLDLVPEPTERITEADLDDAPEDRDETGSQWEDR